MKNYKTIQALRGLAAFAVMMFHYRSAFNLPFYPFGEKLFISGNMGVPLFFVISGFVMGLPDYEPGTRSAWAFAVKRVARIVPLYLLATILWCYVSVPDFSILQSGADLSDIAKAMIFYPMGGSHAPLFGAKLFVGWTLNYEMLFYGVLALGILVGRPWIVIAAVFGCTLWALPAAMHKFSMDPFVEYGFPVGYVRVATNPIVWNFLTGVLAARLVRVLPSIGKKPQLALCIATSIAVAWQCFSGYRTGYGLLQSGAGFAALVLMLAWYEKCHGATVSKSLVFLGDISFSLYIWHYILHAWLSEYMIKIGLLEYSRGFLYGLTVSAIAVFVSWISYELIEQRLSNWLRNALLFHRKSVSQESSPALHRQS